MAVPVGSHVPVTGGLIKGALRYADEIGAEAVQDLALLKQLRRRKPAFSG